MADMKKFNETINSSKRSTDFAAHFTSKTSIKNLLKATGVGHEKTLTKAFDDKFGNLLVGSDAVLEPLVTLSEQAFAATVAENEKWIADGNTKGLPERVAYLIGVFTDSVKNTDDGKALVEAMVKLADNDGVKKLAYELQKDGFEKDKVDECLIDVFLLVGLRHIIIAATNYEAPRATDQNGNPVETEEQPPVSSAGAGHSADKPSNNETANPEPQPESQPEEPKVEKQEDCYTLVARNLKTACTENEVFDNIKLLLNELSDNASNEMMHMAGNVLRPYSEGIANAIIKTFASEVTNIPEDNVDTTYGFARRVLCGMLPHNWKSGINVDSLISTFATKLDEMGLDTELDYDQCCIMLTSYASVIYKLIAMTSSDCGDVVRGYSFIVKWLDVTRSGGDSVETAKTLLAGLDKELPDLMKRVNKEIETPWERTHGTFDIMITGIWEDAAKRALRNGLSLIGKAA